MKSITKLLLSTLIGLVLVSALLAQNDQLPVSDKKSEKHKNQDPLVLVDNMPRFPGCEDSTKTLREIDLCARDLLLDYIDQNIDYPEQSIPDCKEVTVVIQFVIDTDGNILDPKVVRDKTHAGCELSCGQIVMTAVRKMQEEIKWIPGSQNNKAVQVKYLIPIKMKS